MKKKNTQIELEASSVLTGENSGVRNIIAVSLYLTVLCVCVCVCIIQEVDQLFGILASS